MRAFTIPGRLPGANEYTRACRTHHIVGARMKRDAEETVMAAIEAADVKPTANPVSVVISWYEANNRRDIDNVTFATKFILDALVKCGTIRDDSRLFVVTLTHAIFTDRENPRIEVTLVEVEAA